MSVLENRRIVGYSYIRVLSCLAIVFLHGFFLAATYAGFDTTNYIIGMSVRNVFLWSVPCFVMVSGALLLDPNKTMTYDKLFKKYILKVAVALVAFTVINTIYSGITDGTSFGDTFKAIWTNLLSGSGWPHMWYLYMLIAMYLTLPFFRIVVKNSNQKLLNYMLGVMAIVLSVIPGILGLFGISSGFYLWTNTIYPFYFILGYYIVAFNKTVNKALAASVFAVCQVLLVVLTILGKNSVISTYNFPLVVISGVAVFMLLRSAVCKISLISSVIDSIDKATFGIYLVHLIVLRTLFLIYNPFTGYLSWAVVIFYSIVSFIVSWAIDFAYKKIVLLLKKRV